EHIGFTPAWIAASLVGALMNSVYLQAVLKGWRNSVLFTLALLREWLKHAPYLRSSPAITSYCTIPARTARLCHRITIAARSCRK
ncbi:inner membrane CreD family protein, partial [Salmonella enterica subsp. enterica serovar Kentucky]|nr:inner membrane CreD family protein [Salmonella enterica subsp. enterica serovar Kentucky]